MSHYTFTLLPQVYRWIVTDQVIPNRGELNQKSQVVIPQQLNGEFQNGVIIAKTIKLIMAKSGQKIPSHLEGIVNQQTKAAKTTNWNFIWLCFEQLRLQFDQRIRDLILQGEYALIPEILKQLCQRDQNKNEKEMQKILINQKALLNKLDLKNKTNKTNTLDIKKINLQKDPSESESSLQFLILLLGKSFVMPVEEILGLFTNQNKYLAHLFVKGINDGFEGVILFYSLLLKHQNKLKEFLERDPIDSQSLLYAIKPGMISKNQKAAELTIDIFFKLPKIYEWFVSDVGRGATTLFLGIKRHPNITNRYWQLLMKVIQNEQFQFFVNHFKKCFRDSEELTEITTYMLPFVASSFIKPQLIETGVIDQLANLALSLMQNGIQQKIISFRFIGSLMGSFQELFQQNQDYLNGIRSNWKDYNIIDFTLLIQQILVVLENLALEKKPMARRLYQILIEIMQAVMQISDKREYLVRGFTTLVSRFPKIPTQYMIELYKQNNLLTSDLEFIVNSIQFAPDTNARTRIAQILVKIFNNQPLLDAYLAPYIFKICKGTFSQETGKILTMKVIRQCLTQYAQLQGSKKSAEVAKKQPMYFVQKGNQKYKEEEQTQFLTVDKSGKNVFSLIQKLVDLVLSAKSENMTSNLKQQLLQTNAIIKKNHYKANSKSISNILYRKFGVNREEQEQFNEDYRVKKSLVALDQSIAKRRLANSTAGVPMSASRYAGPEHLKKDFDEIVQKRKKQLQEQKLLQQKRQKEQVIKRIQVKKQLQKTNLLRGFGQQAQLKQQGFWSKLMKQNKQLQLYPPQLMQARDLEYIQNLFKRYHRVLRTLFFKYTSSKYTTRSNNNSNFQDNKQRNQTLHIGELIQFLKDFKLFFLTNKDEVSSLVRDINIKLLNKRQTQQLDFNAFQQFVIQFCALIYTKTHTINANTNKGMETIKKNFGHLSHLQLVEQWFNYLKLVFIQKGEKTAIFDEPEAVYFNETEVIKQFSKKIQQDPGFILPEGYKKVTQKVLKLVPKISDRYTKIKSANKDVYEILDQILFESDLRIHILEPLIEKQTKIRVKPHAFVNIKTKLLQSAEPKARAFSSILDKKTVIPPVKLLQKKTLSFGMKLGLSYVSYKDKLLGEQVAYVLDDMITAVETGRTTIDKQKIVNEYLKKKQEDMQKQKFAQIEKQKKRLQRKNELQKMKKDLTQKKQKQLQENKQERERKQQKKLSRQKRLKQDKQKYLQEQKKKLEQKKKIQQQQQAKKTEQQKRKKQSAKRKEAEFKTFNQKQIQKYKKDFDLQAEKKKKQIQLQSQQQKKKQQLVRKLRTKIHQSDKKAIQAKQKMLEEINDLYSSEPVKQVFSDFQPSIRAIFDFLLRTSYLPLTQKKNNSEIIYETWHYFCLVFQLNPIIINAKQLTKIFRHFTKDKQNHKDYAIGLTYDEFKQSLLRIAIKHKSIFNKLSQKIKQNMTSGQIDAVVQKDIEEKQRNQFQQPKQIDVRNLLKEEDIKKDLTDHYGDLSKVNQKTLKGLIYYLKVPKDKQGQEKRFREIIASKISYSLSKIEQLRQKLNDEYTLTAPQKSKKKGEGNTSTSQIMNSSSIENKQEFP